MCITHRHTHSFAVVVSINGPFFINKFSLRVASEMIGLYHHKCFSNSINTIGVQTIVDGRACITESFSFFSSFIDWVYCCSVFRLYSKNNIRAFIDLYLNLCISFLFFLFYQRSLISQAVCKHIFPSGENWNTK